MQEVKKIVIIGPESTGKSTLCEKLADHFSTLYCPEYAREYLNQNKATYTYNDLLKIAEGQLTIEDFLTEKIKTERTEPADGKPPILFLDTDMHVMKVWCEFVFNKVHPFILQQLILRKYDLYLLTNVDLPWVRDHLREYPDLETRSRLFAIYKDIMQSQSTPWVEISGNYEERFHAAIDAIEKYITP